MGQLITPNDPEFKQITDRVSLDDETGDLSVIASGAIAVEFDIKSHHRGKFELHHAKIEQNATLTKLVYHFKKCSLNTMKALGEEAYKLLIEKINPGHPVRITCGPSPLADEVPEFRAQWDLIVLNVPSMNASILDNAILSSMMALEL